MQRLSTALIFLLVFIFIFSSCAPKPAVETALKNTEVPAAASTEPPAATTAAEPAPTLSEGPTTAELISQAEARGELDAETALIYQVLADFSDPRLPAAYRGSPRAFGDSHILDEVSLRFAQLSAETQAILVPFLMPPVYVGSWGDPQTQQQALPAPQPTATGLAPGEGGNSGIEPGEPGTEPESSPTEFDLPCNQIDLDRWEYKSGMHSPLRVWWLNSRPEDSAEADRIIAAMDNDVWPRLTGLMGRIPPPDGDQKCNGGSPDYDIYLAPMTKGGLTTAYLPACKNAPTYISLEPGIDISFLVHEFMHAITWAYEFAGGCKAPEYSWVSEATSDWAIDFVYPDNNYEHRSIKGYYNPPSGKLSLPTKDGQHEYGAYLFLFFLARQFGDPGIIRTIWENAEKMKSVPAVDASIPGGFEAVWDVFSVNNVIEPPYDDYQKWDLLNVKPSGISLIEGQIPATPGFFMGANRLPPLAHKYEWYTFSEDVSLFTYFNGLAFDLKEAPFNAYMGVLPINDGSTYVEFEKRGSSDVEGLKVQAYFKVAGDVEWQIEDWTDRPYVSFCRDASAERLTDLIVISSNSSMEQEISGGGNQYTASDIGCWRYSGSASMTMSGSGEGGTFADQQQVPQVLFERTDVHPNIPYPFLHFKLKEGTNNRSYTYLGGSNGCTGSGEASSALSSPVTEAYQNDFFILYGAVSGPSVNRYSGQATTRGVLEVNFTCPEGSKVGSVQPFWWFAVDLLSMSSQKVYTVGKSGVLKGSGDLVEEASNASMIYQWDFVSLKQSRENGSGGEAQQQASQIPLSSSLYNSPLAPVPPPGGEEPSPTPVPASLPGIPDYPNSLSAVAVSATSMMVTTTDGVDAAKIFYQQAMSALGWMESPSAGTTPDPNFVQLTFVKGQQLAMLMISAGDEGTTIMITLLGG